MPVRQSSSTVQNIAVEGALIIVHISNKRKNIDLDNVTSSLSDTFWHFRCCYRIGPILRRTIFEDLFCRLRN